MDKSYCIFDMDGTLVDSMRFWYELGYSYLRAFGITPTQAQMYPTIPMPLQQTAEYFQHLFQIPRTVEQMKAAMLERVAQFYRDSVDIKPGVREYLDSLKKRGVRLCIATATAEQLVKVCLERVGISGYFDFILSGEDIGFGKEQPELYLRSSARFGVKPQDIAVFEDSLLAAGTAKAAGFYTVGVYDEVSREDQPQLRALCDLYIKDFSQLL